MFGSQRSLLILGLASLLVVGLAACGGGPEPETDTTMQTPPPDTTETPPPPPPPPPAPEPEPELTLEDVYFEFDKAELRADARQILQEDARYLRENPDQSVTIEGHCDERGTNEYNLALGQRRADAVMDYLVDLGVSASRLSTVSYGEERPFALGGTETAWAQNRRAHFKVN